MTKFILHGGQTGIPNEANKKFYQEWIKDFSSDYVPTIMLVFFAREQKDWQKLKQQDEERFAKYNQQRPAKFIIASTDLNVFKDQLQQADVIYFRGGSTEKLMRTIQGLRSELRDLLATKVFAGSSAGVMLISDFSQSTDTEVGANHWTRGFGLIPINSIVHYTAKSLKNVEDFKKNHPDNKNEFILLPETEFVVRNY